MEQSFRSIIVALTGITFLVTAIALDAIILDAGTWTVLLAIAGVGLTAVGLYKLRVELAGLIRQRRGEIAVFTIGVIGVLVVVAYFSTRSRIIS